MSPRQRREELKNLLLVMRNTDMASMVAPHGSATSLLPETMQVLWVDQYFMVTYSHMNSLKQNKLLRCVTGSNA